MTFQVHRLSYILAGGDAARPGHWLTDGVPAGPLMGGPQCRMSILGNGNVAFL